MSKAYIRPDFLLNTKSQSVDRELVLLLADLTWMNQRTTVEPYLIKNKQGMSIVHQNENVFLLSHKWTAKWFTE